MKIILRLTLLILLGFLVACKPKLVSISPPDNSFTIKFPGVPNDVSSPADKSIGVTGGRSFSATSAGREYIVTYTDYDANLFSGISEKELLDVATREVVADGQLLSENNASTSTGIGRELSIIVPNGRLRHTKYFLVGSRLYQLDVYSNKDDKSSREAESFFDSFQLN